jgi:hypothetical protein
MNEIFFLKFDSNRKFGVEIELNSLDKRDFKKRPLKNRERPEGTRYISDRCTSVLKRYYRESLRDYVDPKVSVKGWHHTHGNKNWILKPDSSCGLELCSRILSGWQGIEEVCKIVNSIKNDPIISADDRCSFHCHIDVSDLSESQIANVITYWIKCEAVFLDSIPSHRKTNRYCQSLGLSDIFQHDSKFSSKEIISLVGDMKYYTLNTYHKKRGRRDTIEFRIIGSDGCKNPYLVKNWIRLLIHFVEMSKKHKKPRTYKKDDSWSSFLWLDPDEVFYFLRLHHNEYLLSKGLEETRNWFVARLFENMRLSSKGVFGQRSSSFLKLKKIIKDIGISEKCLNSYLTGRKTLYSNDYRT